MSAPRIGSNPYANLARTMETGFEAPVAKSGAGEAAATQVPNPVQADSFDDPVMNEVRALFQSWGPATPSTTPGTTPSTPGTTPSTPGTTPSTPGTTTPPPANNLTTDKRGYPKGTVQVGADNKVEIPGLGTFEAPAPGKESKVKLDKKNTLHLKRNEDGSVSVEVKKKKKKGFFSKLGGALKKVGSFIKKALPIVSTIASFIPGLNFIAIPLKIATAAMGAMDAIKNKNWLGAIGSIAGGVAGGAAAFGAKGLANTAGMIANGAGKAEALMGAIKSKSPSGILGAAAGMLQFGSGAVANKSAEWSNRLNSWAETAQKWGKYAGMIENPQAAIQGALQGAIQNRIGQ
jgi:hypothetical protein